MRLAVVNKLFKSFIYVDQDITSIKVRVIDVSTDTIVDTIDAHFSVIIPYICHCIYVFPKTGIFRLSWFAENINTDLYTELVYVTSAADALDRGYVVGKGYSLFPEYESPDLGTDVTLTIYDSRVKEIDTYDTTYLTNIYVTTTSVIFKSADTYIGIWKNSNGDVLHLDCWDVFSSILTRSLTIGVSDAHGLPYSNLRGYLVSADGRSSISFDLDTAGLTTINVEAGNYYVVFFDIYHPQRVFTRNNFLLTVYPPKAADDVNRIVYTLDWIDLPEIPNPRLQLPSNYYSWLHIRIATGPAGVAVTYKRLGVTLLNPIRCGNTIVTPATTFYYLDDDGKCTIPLIRGSDVKLFFASTDFCVVFTVPNKPEFDLTEVFTLDKVGIQAAPIFIPYKESL